MESSFEFCQLDVSHFCFRLCFYFLAILSVFFLFPFTIIFFICLDSVGQENAWSELKNCQWIKKGNSEQALKKLAIKVWRTITPE